MSKGAEDIDQERLREQIERLSRLIRQQGFAQGLNPAQWEALRFIGRANRFSNSPGSLAQYLGATKGTVSQTILSLEKKGLVEKKASPSDARIVKLSLSAQGTELLAQDPLLGLGAEIDALGSKTAKRFAKAIDEILTGQIRRLKESEFGNCITCRHWRDRSGEDVESYCMLLNVHLQKQETRQLCQFHLQR